MCADVLLQVPRRLEGLVAHVLGTLVGLLPRVRAEVALEAVPRGEGLPTGRHVAAVRPVARVRALVHLGWRDSATRWSALLNLIIITSRSIYFGFLRHKQQSYKAGCNSEYLTFMKTVWNM